MAKIESIDKQTLLFSIATNGYDRIFKDCLDSHQAYADRNGYKYIAFTKSPPSGISGTNSAWLKVAIMLSALKKGYEHVFFIDGDALICDRTPPISSVFCDDKFIYMSVESSGRFNSGVIIVINDRKSIEFFKQLLLRADIPTMLLPAADRCLYENGHVINLAKKSSIVKIIDPKWNYNYNTVLLNEHDKEYISHGRGTWTQKPRSQSQPMSLWRSLSLRMTQGPRYFLLDRLLKFYEHEYEF
jgi:hypothetical protein